MQTSINFNYLKFSTIIYDIFKIFESVVAPTYTLLDPSLVAMEVYRDIYGRLNNEDITQVIRKVVVEKSGEGFKN